MIQLRIGFLFQSFARMIKFLTLLEKIFERLVTLRGNQRSLLRRGTPIKNVTSYCVSGCKRPNCHLVSKSNWLILRFWLSDCHQYFLSQHRKQLLCLCEEQRRPAQVTTVLGALGLLASANCLTLKYYSPSHQRSR